MSKSQFSIWYMLVAMAILAAIFAYQFRPLREVIYVRQGNYTDSSEIVEFVESGRRIKIDIQGRVGDKFKIQSWMK